MTRHRRTFSAALLGAATLMSLALIATSAVSASAQPGPLAASVQSIKLTHVGNPTRVAVSPDNNWVWVADEKNGIVEVVDARTRTSTGRFVKVENAEVDVLIRQISVSPLDGWVAYVTMSDEVVRVDMHNQTSTHAASGPSTTGAVAGVDDTLVLSRFDYGTSLVDQKSGQSTVLSGTLLPQGGLALSADGRTAYARSVLGSVTAVDIRARTAGATYAMPMVTMEGATRTAVSTSGRYLYGSGSGGSIVSIDTVTGISTSAPGGIGAPGDVSASGRDGAYFIASGPDLVLVQGNTILDRVHTPANTLHNPVYAAGTNTIFAGSSMGLIAAVDTSTSGVGQSIFGS